ncbi:MAG TPA: MXAN_5187 C-terminal domain-containing protein [Vicinamibacterales bacterium]|nr:MXAN_5187 C-terminal domain-containing protein [Vicinamibacterales bacterium]
MPEPNDIQRDLKLLEAELKKLEAEYNMFFAGRLPRPPWETRARVESIIKRWERGQIQTSIDRFRFNTLQTRFVTFADLWDRGLRAREEGRPGPFGLPQPPAAEPKKAEEPEKAEPKVVFATSMHDPSREMDKLHSLYDSLMDARRQAGDDVVPFHKFTALVKEQVKRLKGGGNEEVAFRVAVKDGKVSFTARGVKGKKQS